jgi:hypothetical protein
MHDKLQAFVHARASLHKHLHPLNIITRQLPSIATSRAPDLTAATARAQILTAPAAGPALQGTVTDPVNTTIRCTDAWRLADS